MLKLRDFTIWKILANFDTLKKKHKRKTLEQSDAYHCVASPLTILQLMRLVSGIVGEECCPFLVRHRIQLLNSPGSSLPDSSFYDAPNVFFLLVRGLDCRIKPVFNAVPPEGLNCV